MSEIIKIYLLNVINDIDNIIIITAVIRKYGFRLKLLFPYIVVCLTLTRTFYVLIINSLAEVPGLRVVTGLIILSIVMRLAWSTNSIKKIKSLTYKPVKSFIRIMFVVIITDFTVCLDSVMITSEISSNPTFIFVSIFLSVATVFIVFFSYSELFIATSWIQIIASGLIAHIAILGIVKDPITKKPISLLESFFNIEIHNWIHIFALDMAIIIVIIGVIKKIQSQAPLS